MPKTAGSGKSSAAGSSQPTPRPWEAAIVVCTALVIFLAATLLFQVEPLIGKCILPWFGGGPSVWTTCLMVFQTLLFAGYAYAHLVARLSPLPQRAVHAVIVLAALACLPVLPSADWKPTGSEHPTLRIVLILVTSVGLPFFVLSATGPLVQRWHAFLVPGKSPYHLYALSNAGSLIGLITYPFVIEPSLPVPVQSMLWSIGFVIYGLLVVAVAAGSLWGGWSAVADGATTTGTALEIPDRRAVAVGWSQIALWFALAVVPSVMLLAVTNTICLDVASVPFLWVLPLTLYLVSFILCFGSSRSYSRSLFLPATAVAAAALVGVLLVPGTSIALQVAVCLALLFTVSMFCHGELTRSKPGTDGLTLFYLVISAAGAVGAVCVSLLAPLIFTSFIELHLATMATLGLGLLIVYRDPRSRLAGGRPAWAWAAMLSCGALLGVGFAYDALDLSHAGVIYSTRNFYGLLGVCEEHVEDPERAVRFLSHGNTWHGAQFTNPTRRREPTMYYVEQSGIGIALRHHAVGRPRRIGVIGLGVGTLATYAEAEDTLQFYEIDPDVLKCARTYFSFLDDCRGRWSVVLGDARLALESDLGKSEPQGFDVLVVDAFSSDSIPLHLLTEEAMSVYLRHLAPGGLLAFHISNRHLNLQPVLMGLVRRYSLLSRLVDVRERRQGDGTSTWVLMSRDATVLGGIFAEYPPLDEPRTVAWSDAYCSLAAVVKGWTLAPQGPGNPMLAAAFDRGVERLERGDLVAAEAAFREALRVDDRDPFVWMRLGDTMRKQSRPQDALRCYEQAVKIDAGYADAYNNIAALLAATDPHRAEEVLRLAIRAAPHNAEAQANLGFLLMRRGAAAGAVEHFEKALRIKPGLVAVRAALEQLAPAGVPAR